MPSFKIFYWVEIVNNNNKKILIFNPYTIPYKTLELTGTSNIVETWGQKGSKGWKPQVYIIIYLS